MWYLIFFVTILSTVYDLKYRRIPNLFTMPTVCVGIVWNMFSYGYREMVLHLLIVIITFLIFLIPYHIKALGAGDIKLIMAIVAFIPYEIIINFFIFFFLCGATFSFFMMLYQKRVGIGLCNVKNYLFNTLLIQKIQIIDEEKSTSYIAYSIPIALSLVIVYVMYIL